MLIKGTTSIIVSDAEAALAFYTKAFGAKEYVRLAMPDGGIAHCEFHIGNAILMMGNEVVSMGWRAPTSLGGTPVSFMIYTEDCDAMFTQETSAQLKEFRTEKFLWVRFTFPIILGWLKDGSTRSFSTQNLKKI